VSGRDARAAWLSPDTAVRAQAPTTPANSKGNTFGKKALPKQGQVREETHAKEVREERSSTLNPSPKPEDVTKFGRPALIQHRIAALSICGRVLLPIFGSEVGACLKTFPNDVARPPHSRALYQHITCPSSSTHPRDLLICSQQARLGRGKL
jgi:hypothetical protein